MISDLGRSGVIAAVLLRLLYLMFVQALGLDGALEDDAAVLEFLDHLHNRVIDREAHGDAARGSSAAPRADAGCRPTRPTTGIEFRAVIANSEDEGASSVSLQNPTAHCMSLT